ncbi:hypothetical protein D5R40_33845, partial [Okeania hirsuta]
EFMIVLTNDAITLPPVRLRNLKLDFFNPNVGRAPGDLFEPDAGEEHVHAFQDNDCECTQPDFSDRVAWNCPDGNTFSGSGSPVMTEVTHMIVHHSADLIRVAIGEQRFWRSGICIRILMAGMTSVTTG